jgi:hypothetical protein
MARGRAEHFPVAQFARLNGVFIVVHGVLNFHLRDTMGASGRKIKNSTALQANLVLCGAASFYFGDRVERESNARREGCRPAAGCATSGFTSHKNAPATERELSRKLRSFLFRRRREHAKCGTGRDSSHV